MIMLQTVNIIRNLGFTTGQLHIITNRQKYFRFHVKGMCLKTLYFSSKKSFRKSLCLYFSSTKYLRLYFSRKIPFEPCISLCPPLLWCTTLVDMSCTVHQYFTVASVMAAIMSHWVIHSGNFLFYCTCQKVYLSNISKEVDRTTFHIVGQADTLTKHIRPWSGGN